MKATERFYLCEHCGNMAGLIHDAGVPMMCCGQPMKHLVANTTDAATEKHVPAVTIEGNTLKVHVGEVTHPMLEEHYIQWIYLQTENGGQRISLHPNEAPEATFSIEHDAPVAVFEYCNLHGLWTVSYTHLSRLCSIFAPSALPKAILETAAAIP